MLRVKDIIKKLKIFKRNKIPIEIKILANCNLHSNIFGKKDCQNSLRDLSSLENIGLELDKQV